VNAGKFETAVEVSWDVVIANPLGLDFFFSPWGPPTPGWAPAGLLVYRFVGMIRPIINCLRP